MGTPHQGGNGVPLGRLILKVASLAAKADDKILKHLERDSEWLQQQLIQYNPISSDFVTKFAYETLPTQTVLGGATMVSFIVAFTWGTNPSQIVPHISAVVPGAADAESVAIHADHINMVKFDSRGDNGYKRVSGHLRLLAQKAPDAVRASRVKQEWAEEGTFTI